VALANEKSTDGNGNVVRAEIGYAKAQNASVKDGVGAEAGAGLANVTVTVPGGNTTGQVNVQGLTASANAQASGSLSKLEAKGSVGAEAKVVEFSGQLSIKVGNHTLAAKGTVDLVGVGAKGSASVSPRGFSAELKVIAGALGAGLKVSFEPSN